MQVSILIPARDPDPVHFKECLESVMAQDFQNLEVILVDNGGWTRETNRIIRSTVPAGNLKIIREETPGIRYALNTGLDVCEGQFIARMDADDIMTPERIRQQAEHLTSDPHLGVTGGLVELIDHNNNSEGMLHYVAEVNELITHDDIYHYRFVDSPMIHPSIMFRRSLLELGKYPEAPGEPEDYSMILNWMQCGVRFGKVDAKILYWRDSPTRLTRRHEDYSRDAFHRVRSRYLPESINLTLNDRDLWIWGAGKYTGRMIELLESAGIRVEGVIDVVRNKTVMGKTSMHYSDIPKGGEIFILSVVSNRGKHLEIRNYLNSLDYTEGNDFIRCSP